MSIKKRVLHCISLSLLLFLFLFSVYTWWLLRKTTSFWKKQNERRETSETSHQRCPHSPGTERDPQRDTPLLNDAVWFGAAAFASRENRWRREREWWDREEEGGPLTSPTIPLLAIFPILPVSLALLPTRFLPTHASTLSISFIFSNYLFL